MSYSLHISIIMTPSQSGQIMSL